MNQKPGNAGSELGGATTPEPSAANEKNDNPEPSAHDFRPIRIKGEPLSETIIRERRERP